MASARVLRVAAGWVPVLALIVTLAAYSAEDPSAVTRKMHRGKIPLGSFPLMVDDTKNQALRACRSGRGQS
jgi:hypothetical protein